MSIKLVATLAYNGDYSEALRVADEWVAKNPKDLVGICRMLTYKMHCYTNLDLFEKTSEASEELVNILNKDFNFPKGSRPDKPMPPIDVLVYSSYFGAECCLAIGNKTSTYNFLEAALLFNLELRDEWIDNQITNLTIKTIQSNIEQDKLNLETIYNV